MACSGGGAESEKNMNLLDEMDEISVRVNLFHGEAALLLQGLEAQREELGTLAEELIDLLRSKGVTTPTE